MGVTAENGLAALFIVFSTTPWAFFLRCENFDNGDRCANLVINDFYIVFLECLRHRNVSGNRLLGGRTIYTVCGG